MEEGVHPHTKLVVVVFVLGLLPYSDSEYWVYNFAGASCVLFWFSVSCKLSNNHNVTIFGVGYDLNF